MLEVLPADLDVGLGVAGEAVAEGEGHLGHAQVGRPHGDLEQDLEPVGGQAVVELAKESQTPVQNAPFAERADVKEIGQDLQKQGAE